MEFFYIVTWWLKAGIVEQEEAAFARQQWGKHAATEELLEVVFSVWSMPSLYN
jgi:hypothetical protein